MSKLYNLFTMEIWLVCLTNWNGCATAYLYHYQLEIEKGEIWRNCSRSARPNHFLLGHFPQGEGNELEFRFRSTECWTSGIGLRGWGWPWWQPLADPWQYPGLTHHIEPRAHHRHIAAISRCFTAGAKIGQNQAFLRRKEGRVELFFFFRSCCIFQSLFFIFGRLLSLSLTYVLIGKNIKI